MRKYREKGIDAAWRPPTDRGRELFRVYALAPYTPFFSRSTFDELLGALDLLDRVSPALIDVGSKTGSLRILDVGSKNWAYVGALTAWLRRHQPARTIELTGVEIAGTRWYWDLTSRETRARYYAEHASAVSGVRAQFVTSDVREIKGEFDIAVWLFPYVLEETHRAGGLGAQSFDPHSTFAHVESLLAPQGQLVLANQGEWEWEKVDGLFSRLKLRSKQTSEGSMHASAHPIWLSHWS